MAILNAQHGLRTRGGYNVDIKLSGDWVKFNMLISSMNIKVMAAASLAQREFAEKYRDRVKTNIRTGGRRFGYPPHSDKYSRYKGHYGGPSKQLMWSGAMHDAVQVMPLKGGRVGVGISRNAQREPYHGKETRLLPISEYANVLEHGSGGDQPPRPVFSDTFKEDMGGMKGLKTFIEWKLVRSFAKQGTILTKL